MFPFCNKKKDDSALHSSFSVKVASRVAKVQKAKARSATLRLSFSSVASTQKAFDAARNSTFFRYGTSGSPSSSERSVEATRAYPRFSSPNLIEFSRRESEVILDNLSLIEFAKDGQEDTTIDSIGSPKAEVIVLAADRDLEIGALATPTSGWVAQTLASLGRTCCCRRSEVPSGSKPESFVLSPVQSSLNSSEEDEEYLDKAKYARQIAANRKKSGLFLEAPVFEFWQILVFVFIVLAIPTIALIFHLFHLH